ncbi:MAG: D-TA family PLP-dependent enzyme [Hyphomicrobiales bacterium]
MSIESLKSEIARDFGTPALVIDLDVVDHNIAKAQAYCDAAGVRNRPHIKTHKSPILAAMQRDAGAIGITCQKLGEAEVMAAGGLDDILITYNLLGEEKIGRLGRLSAEKTVTVAADNPVTISGLPMAGRIAGRPINVVVECDSGRKRAGVETPGEAISLVKQISESPELSFAGFVFYPPDKTVASSQVFLDEAVSGVRALGLEPRILSSGGSPNLGMLKEFKGITEHRAGTYIYNDRMMMAHEMATLDECALHVYATVVSRAGEERGILDAGSKTLTSDTGGGVDGFGLIREYPQARIAGFSEEHGMLDLVKIKERPSVGTIVRIVPNHVCVVVNMFDRYVLVRGDKLVGEIDIPARGRIT